MSIKRVTPRGFLLIIAALVIIHTGCHQDQPMEGVVGEIPIGVAIPLTGPLSSVGVTLLSGAELAQDEINESQLSDARIKLFIENSRGNPDGAVEAFNKLIDQDKVSAILGPATSSASQVVFPIAQEKQVVAVAPIAAASGLTEIGDFLFRINPTVDVLVPSGVKTTHEKLGYQKVAVLVDSVDLFSQSDYEVLQEALDANGVEILVTEFFETEETDFSGQLTRIKELDPDAIFVSALPPETTEILIQGRQLGIPNTVPFLVSLTLTQDEIQRAGAAAEGMITFTTWIKSAETPGNQTFVQNYTAKYGIEPSRRAAQSYTAIRILAQAIRDAQSIESSAIRDAMADIRDLETILGKFSFDANGDAIYNPITVVVRDGQYEVFD